MASRHKQAQVKMDDNAGGMAVSMMDDQQ